jgi:hypothetical protein
VKPFFSESPALSAVRCRYLRYITLSPGPNYYVLIIFRLSVSPVLHLESVDASMSCRKPAISLRRLSRSLCYQSNRRYSHTALTRAASLGDDRASREMSESSRPSALTFELLARCSVSAVVRERILYPPVDKSPRPPRHAPLSSTFRMAQSSFPSSCQWLRKLPSRD